MRTCPVSEFFLTHLTGSANGMYSSLDTSPSSESCPEHCNDQAQYHENNVKPNKAEPPKSWNTESVPSYHQNGSYQAQKQENKPNMEMEGICVWIDIRFLHHQSCTKPKPHVKHRMSKALGQSHRLLASSVGDFILIFIIIGEW